MQYFPIFVSMDQQRVLISGSGEVAEAKLRLLLKTSARLEVYGAEPTAQVCQWAQQYLLILHRRELTQLDLQITDKPESHQNGASTSPRLLYIANGEDVTDRRIAALAERNSVLFSVVDRLDLSQFITPAIVDRDPVVVAIGTEGTAPVLARRIKSRNESELSPKLGALARVAQTHREAVQNLPTISERRRCWQSFFDSHGVAALNEDGVKGAEQELHKLIEQQTRENSVESRVSIVGAGPGDPELLTLKARRLLGDADVVIYDRLVAPQILELARREASFINVGKAPGQIGWTQDEINSELVSRASNGAQVVRLKSGDPSLYGRLDEEMAALDDAGIAYEIVPGVTSALSAAAAAKVSLTKRHRNSSVRFITGQDIEGFAEHDWDALAKPDGVAVMYMGRSASRFVQGRLLLHGAARTTPVTLVENASRADQRIFNTTLQSVDETIEQEAISGPVIIMFGLQSRVADMCKSTDDETKFYLSATTA